MEDLVQAIQKLHGCTATYLESVEVKEAFQGQTAWEGTVHVFEVDHHDTDTCYAWSSAIDDSTKRKYYAVLKLPPVDSPLAAVRASIVAEYKGETGN